MLAEFFDLDVVLLNFGFVLGDILMIDSV